MIDKIAYYQNTVCRIISTVEDDMVDIILSPITFDKYQEYKSMFGVQFSGIERRVHLSELKVPSYTKIFVNDHEIEVQSQRYKDFVTLIATDYPTASDFVVVKINGTQISITNNTFLSLASMIEND